MYLQSISVVVGLVLFVVMLSAWCTRSSYTMRGEREIISHPLPASSDDSSDSMYQVLPERDISESVFESSPDSDSSSRLAVIDEAIEED